jgi:C_GCAxxG_C_C family probable redox protein
MINNAVLQKQIEDLRTRVWDEDRILKDVEYLIDHDIPQKSLDKQAIIAQRDEILERVSKKAQEYEFITFNCAQGTALALMEEFGLGNMAIFKSLSALPGCGMTGEICGAVSGALLVLGLYFSREFTKQEITPGMHLAPGYLATREYMKKFNETFGSDKCAKLHELIYGRPIDPFATPTAFGDFMVKESGRSICTLPPAYGARIAASIIIDSMKE